MLRERRRLTYEEDHQQKLQLIETRIISFTPRGINRLFDRSAFLVSKFSSLTFSGVRHISRAAFQLEKQ